MEKGLRSERRPVDQRPWRSKQLFSYFIIPEAKIDEPIGEKMNTPSDEQKKLNSGQIPTPEETKLKVLQQKNGDDAGEAAILKICQKHYLNMMSSNIDFVCYIQSFCMFEKFIERLVFVMLGARL
ncbi:hypothetical protein ACS0TY_013571 [Phlomoides rotata]